jgi:hypothetical protein
MPEDVDEGEVMRRHQIRATPPGGRIGVLVAAVGTAVALGLFGLANSQAAGAEAPTLFVSGCEGSPSEPYGGTLSVTGLEPNTMYLLHYVGIGGDYFTTDDAGGYAGVGGGSSSEPFELTVQIGRDLTHDGFLDAGESIAIEQHFTFDRPCGEKPPAPTAKSQCKKGGWKQFGFKNQGQCIRSVKHGPKR